MFTRSVKLPAPNRQMNWSLIDAFKWLFARGAPAAQPDLRAFADLQPGDIAIDAGANVGDITAVMAATGATVYAFEPNPFAFKALRRRFASNPNVHCINKAVLDRAAKLPLYFHQNSRWNKIKWSNGSS